MNQFRLKIYRAKKKQDTYIANIFIISIALISITLFSLFFFYSKKIIVEPKVAKYFTEIKQGKVLILFSRIFLVSSNAEIVFRANNYEDIIKKISKDEKEIILKFIKKDIYVTFMADTKLGENQWFMNDNLIASEKSFKFSFKPGIYDIRLENEFYKTKFYKLLVKDNSLEMDINLKPERLVGKVFLDSTPSNADIFLNNKKIGYTAGNYELISNNYTLRIEKDGFEKIHDIFSINRKTLNINKKYLLSPLGFTIDIVLNPKGGKLFIDDKIQLEKNKIKLLPNKKYKFSYKKVGFKSVNKYVQINNKDKRIVRLELDKEYGKILIKSDPAGEIFINDNLVGLAPKTLNLQTIKNKLEIRKKGFETYIVTVQTKKNIPSILDVTLKRVKDKKIKSPSTSYSNSLGIKLKLFNPTNFLMGAHRHEKGQRANEFIKNVTLRKRFYLSLTEVSIEQFEKYRNEKFDEKKKNLPITNVTWYEAVKFCNWLSELEDLERVYYFKDDNYSGANLQNNGYRLPTEAEWEWIARKAGRESITRFPWGENLPIPKMVGNLADESVIGFQETYIPNYKDNYKFLSPVGTFKKDLAGLHDIVGNAKEWVHDYYLLSVPKKNMLYYDPSGPIKGLGHVVKGSSYRSSTLQEIRSSFRDSEVDKNIDLGFRIARYLNGKEFINDEK